MRTYKLFFFLFFLFIPFFSNAQLRQNEVSVDIGNKIRNAGSGEIIGAAEGGGVYTLELKEKKRWPAGRKKMVVRLQKYDREMNLKQSEKISFENMQRVPSFGYVQQISDRIVLFAQVYDHENREETIVVQEADPESLQAAGGLKTVLEIASERPGYFSFYSSPDNSKTLLIYEKAGNIQENKALNLFVLDENLKVVWEKEACLSEKNKIFSLEKSLVDNEGNVYLLSTISKEERKTKREGKPDYQYHLVSYKESGTLVNEYVVQLQGKFLTDIQIVVNDRQDITGGGFYSGKNSWHIEGSYFFMIDGHSNELLTKSVKEFPENFMNQDLPDLVRGSKNTTALKYHNFRLSDILLRTDGSVLMVGEQYVVTTRTRTGRKWSSKPKTSYHYEYRDIILVNINNEGEIDRLDKISKNQHSVDDGGFYSSFALSMMNDNAFFVYNRFPEADKALKAASDRKEAVAVMVKVDKDGNQTKREISELKNENITLMPKSGKMTGPAEFVFIGKDKNKDRMLRLKITNKEALMAVIK